MRGTFPCKGVMLVEVLGAQLKRAPPGTLPRPAPVGPAGPPLIDLLVPVCHLRLQVLLVQETPRPQSFLDRCHRSPYRPVRAAQNSGFHPVVRERPGVRCRNRPIKDRRGPSPHGHHRARRAVGERLHRDFQRAVARRRIMLHTAPPSDDLPELRVTDCLPGPCLCAVGVLAARPAIRTGIRLCRWRHAPSVGRGHATA